MTIFPRFEPYSLGMLLGLYEHKVFVQGVVWGIDSFDQWGVDLCKWLEGRLFPAIKGEAGPSQFDASMRGLIPWCRDHGDF